MARIVRMTSHTSASILDSAAQCEKTRRYMNGADFMRILAPRRFRSCRVCSAVAFLLILCSPLWAQTLGYRSNQKRVALVIGNDDYTRGDAPLTVAVNNAAKFSDLIQRPDFDFSLKLTVDNKVENFYYPNRLAGDMRKLLRAFGKETETAESAIFYFSGQAAQSTMDPTGRVTKSARNYLIGVDKTGGEESVLKYSISLDEVVSVMKATRNIIILDCGYSNNQKLMMPDLHRNPGSTFLPGLAVIEPAPRCLIAVPSKPGLSVPLFEEDGNSVYTAALLKALFKGNGDEVFNETRFRLRDSLGALPARRAFLEKLVPQEYAYPTIKVNFLKPVPTPTPAPTPTPRPTPTPEPTPTPVAVVSKMTAADQVTPPTLDSRPEYKREIIPKRTGAQELHQLGMPAKLKAELESRLNQGDRVVSAAFWEGEQGAIRYLLVTQRTILENSAPRDLLVLAKSNLSRIENVFAGPNDKWILTFTDGSIQHSANLDASIVKDLDSASSSRRLGYAVMRKKGYYLQLVDRDGLYVAHHSKEMLPQFLSAIRNLNDDGRHVLGMGFGFSIAPVHFILYGENSVRLSNDVPTEMKQKLNDLQQRNKAVERIDILPGPKGFMILTSRN